MNISAEFNTIKISDCCSWTIENRTVPVFVSYLRKLTLFVLILSGLWSNHILAADIQEEKKIDPNFQQLISEKSGKQEASEENTGLYPNIIDPNILDEAGKKAMQDSLTAYYQYHVEGFSHRQRVFQWQYYSSIVIFIIVITIVFVGLYFSWMQFHATENPNEMPETNMEVSASGLKVSSPVLGVIILVLSFAFFYLYLVYVYPIVDSF